MDRAFFLERVYRIINQYNAKTKKPRRYCGGTLTLYGAETHMLERIGSAPGITATRLAEDLAVTKGAVSQTVAKLRDKGLIQREPAAANAGGLFLTERGRTVFEEHRALHQAMLEQIEAVLREAPEQTRRDLNRLLEIVEQALDTY